MILKILILLIIPTISFFHSLHRVFENVNPTVVVIHTKSDKADRHNLDNKNSNKDNVGSGVVITDDGKIMTASHLVHSADAIFVKFLNGDLMQARVLSSVPYADIALIQIKRLPEKLQVAPLGNSDQALVGDEVFVIGAPYGYSHTVSKGIVSARYNPGELDTELGMSELL